MKISVLIYFCLFLLLSGTVESKECLSKREPASIHPGISMPELNAPSQAHSLKKEVNDKPPFNYKKHNNFLWKTGGGLKVSGVFMITTFTSFFLEFPYSGVGILLLGVLLGVLLLLLSLPFLLLGSFIDRKNREE